MTIEAIYADAKDKYVANYVMYGKTGETELFVDSECKDKASITLDVAMDALKKGALICYDGKYYTPTSFEESGGKASVVIPAGSSGADVTLTSQTNPTEEEE